MNKDTAPYVQAILETALEPWLKSLHAVNRRLHEENLVAAVDDVATPMPARKELLRPVLGDSPVAVSNLIYTLAGAGDVHLLERLVADLEQDLERIGKGVSGVIRSAVPLTPDEKGRMAAKLAGQFGEDVILTYEVDPALIGGVVIRVGDLVIDGSVATKLAALKEQLS